MIRVKTADFDDKDDVKRVLIGLESLHLVLPFSRGRNIFYKPDAYTRLDLYWNNIYGLKMSLYEAILCGGKLGEVEDKTH